MKFVFLSCLCLYVWVGGGGGEERGYKDTLDVDNDTLKFL